MNVCFRHQRMHTCPDAIAVGPYFKEPENPLAWQGAMELLQMGETFITSFNPVRTAVALENPACREYLKQWGIA